jgi:hypothetical protein
MTANLYEGPVDQRQMDDVAFRVSRFWPRYRALTDQEAQLHDAIKSVAEHLESLFCATAPGATTRYLALALTDLESAVMWAIKELTSTRE